MTTIIERPYKVYAGEQEYVDGNWGEDPQRVGISWTYKHSFREWRDAEAYAERISEDYEFVKIEEKENTGD